MRPRTSMFSSYIHSHCIIYLPYSNQDSNKTEDFQTIEKYGNPKNQYYVNINEYSD
jgi:hypothetical protein